jgi:hypothetical protein
MQTSSGCYFTLQSHVRATPLVGYTPVISRS